VWELTLRCNALCRLCGSSAPAKREGELDIHRCVRLAAELIDLGLRSCTLSGGEPLLKDGFFGLARYLVHGGVRTDLVSNGLLIDGEMAAKLADSGVAGVTLSFDGPREIHDELRGVSGCYDQLLRAVDHLRDHGLPVGVITHVNRTNLPHLDRLADGLAEAGVGRWKVQLTVPPGNSKEAEQERLLPEQLPELEALIRRTDRQGKLPCHAAHSFGYFGRHELDVRRWAPRGPRVWHGCHAGLDGIGITSDGDVLGCLSLLTSGDRFIEGNIADRSLAEIWHDPDAFAYTRRFEPDQRSGTCGECHLLDSCRSGCICLLASMDTELRDNPLCLHAVERKRKPAAHRQPPSVVVFVADSLRPDFLGCYGGNAATPTLDRLSERGLRVEHARSGSPWTVPSVASMLTGVSPHKLGLVKWRQAWTEAQADLFSLFGQQDYAVGSFPFDRRHLFTNVPEAKVAGISWDLDGVRDWIVGHHSRPSLTYIHGWGTHIPYSDKHIKNPQWRKVVNLLVAALNHDRTFATKLRGMYELSIRHLDQHVLPRVLKAIAEGRGWDNTIFVLTADHGESWCERYPPDRKVLDVFDFHGRSLHEESLRVPLLLSGAVDGGTVAGPVSHADLAATLCGLCGIDATELPDGMDFRSGVPADRPHYAVADRDFVDARSVPGDPASVYSLFSCLKGHDKLIRDVVSGQLRWYDLAADPAEAHDRIAAGHRPPESLLAEMEREWAAAAPIRWDRDEEAHIRRQLVALGYTQ
jgi:radical SAM protein with 4Fe4S-binding SPASM domain